MVQRLLMRRSSGLRATWVSFLVLLSLTPALAEKSKKAAVQQTPPDLLLEGGRSLKFDRSFSSEREVRGKPGFWGKLVNIVAGEPDFKQMVRPYSIAVDSHKRIIVTDPGMGGIHIFDPVQHKYKFIDRKEKGKNSLFEPQCLAVDAHDNIYVTDSKSGKIFVFEPSGKYHGVFGNLKGGE
ncbi:MAG: hypothetical protein ACM3JB_14085, partial [Acidobacteriaceae bacterium]